MIKYIEAEKQLAVLLGWQNVSSAFGGVGGIAPAPFPANWQECPRWTRDWTVCGPLMVDHDRYPIEVEEQGKPAIVVANGLVDGPGYVVVMVEDHPDKSAAVRYAIVQAVVIKLDSERSAIASAEGT